MRRAAISDILVNSRPNLEVLREQMPLTRDDIVSLVASGKVCRRNRQSV